MAAPFFLQHAASEGTGVVRFEFAKQENAVTQGAHDLLGGLNVEVVVDADGNVVATRADIVKAAKQIRADELKALKAAHDEELKNLE